MQFDPNLQTDPKFQEARVGVACLISSEFDKYNRGYLLGLRQGGIGAGTWGFPGGHLEFGETVKEASIREVKEETDLDVIYVMNMHWNEKFVSNRHYITLYTHCEVEDPRKCKLMEPDKFVDWKWIPYYDMTSIELFEPAAMMKAIRTVHYMDREINV